MQDPARSLPGGGTGAGQGAAAPTAGPAPPLREGKPPPEVQLSLAWRAGHEGCLRLSPHCSCEVQRGAGGCKASTRPAPKFGAVGGEQGQHRDASIPARDLGVSGHARGAAWWGRSSRSRAGLCQPPSWWGNSSKPRVKAAPRSEGNFDEELDSSGLLVFFSLRRFGVFFPPLVITR